MNLVYDNKRTVLHWAATGPTGILLKLLEKKPNLEIIDGNSCTPLMISVQQGNANGEREEIRKIKFSN